MVGFLERIEADALSTAADPPGARRRGQQGDHQANTRLEQVLQDDGQSNARGSLAIKCLVGYESITSSVQTRVYAGPSAGPIPRSEGRTPQDHDGRLTSVV